MRRRWSFINWYTAHLSLFKILRQHNVSLFHQTHLNQSINHSIIYLFHSFHFVQFFLLKMSPHFIDSLDLRSIGFGQISYWFFRTFLPLSFLCMRLLFPVLQIDSASVQESCCCNKLSHCFWIVAFRMRDKESPGSICVLFYVTMARTAWVRLIDLIDLSIVWISLCPIHWHLCMMT